MIDNKDYSPKTAEQPRPGPFLAKVISHLDPSYMGGLEVEILTAVGGNQSSGQVHQVKYLNPFYGVTSSEYTADSTDYNGTQKSYGMWFVPPDTGTTVVVIFIDGDPKRGYWIGCVQDENMNFMVPGIAATQQTVERGPRSPTAEYNKKTNARVADPEQIKKPVHPLAARLAEQGLLADDIRGITTSSARRETPSAVFGISTPGPIDKRPNAPRGAIGKSDCRVPNAFVSRLGGTTFVMDDGDDKFLRKTHAKDGPPAYAAVEQGERGGDVTIPHNELFRIRTRTGHQILLHNSEDLIYICNSRGTTWIELTSNGKIDIYAADDISMHTSGNFNFTAGRDINFTSLNGNINFNAALNFKATAGSNYELLAGADGMLTVGGTSHIKAGAEHRETAGVINMNGPGAASATSAAVASRVPEHEPWAGHENLHGSKLDYTTKTDTFAKVTTAKRP